MFAVRLIRHTKWFKTATRFSRDRQSSFDDGMLLNTLVIQHCNKCIGLQKLHSSSNANSRSEDLHKLKPPQWARGTTTEVDTLSMDDDDKTYVDTLSDLDSGELDDTIDLPDDEDFSAELCDMTQEEDEDLGLAKVNVVDETDSNSQGHVICPQTAVLWVILMPLGILCHFAALKLCGSHVLPVLGVYHTETIVRLIDERVGISNDDVLYIDNNAGSGAVSEALLEAGVKRLAMFRVPTSTNCPLQQIKEAYESANDADNHRSICIHRAHLLRSEVLSVGDKQASVGDSRHTTPSNITIYDWSRDLDGLDLSYLYQQTNPTRRSHAAIRLFMVSVGKSWLHWLNSFLVEGYLDKKNVHMAGRIDAFVLLNHQAVKRLGLLDESSKLSQVILKLRILYHMDLISELSMSSLDVNTAKLNGKDDRMYLVRFLSRDDVMRNGNLHKETRDSVLALYFILQQATRFSTLIPKLEELIKHSCLEVVALGHPFDVSLKDLSHEQLIDLIKALQMMPSYSKSVLNHLEHTRRGAVRQNRDGIKYNPYALRRH